MPVHRVKDIVWIGTGHPLENAAAAAPAPAGAGGRSAREVSTAIVADGGGRQDTDRRQQSLA